MSPTDIPPPDGTPWWAWLIYAVIAVCMPVLIALVSRQHREVAEVKKQVTNTHETNLREDMDKIGSDAAEAKSEATLARESAHRTERLAQDLIRSMRAVEHSMDRREDLNEEFQADSLRDRKAIREELTAFAKDSRADREALHAELAASKADREAIHKIIDPLVGDSD